MIVTRFKRYEDTVAVSDNGKYITIKSSGYERVFTLENNSLFPGPVYHYRSGGGDSGSLLRDYYIVFDDNNNVYGSEVRGDGKEFFIEDKISETNDPSTMFDVGWFISSNKQTITDWIRYDG